MSYFHISHFNRPCFCKGTNIKTSKYHQSQKLIDLGSWCIFQEPSDPRLPLQWKLGFLARCFQFRLVQGHKNIFWARPWKELWDKALKRIAGQGPNFGVTPLPAYKIEDDDFILLNTPQFWYLPWLVKKCLLYVLPHYNLSDSPTHSHFWSQAGTLSTLKCASNSLQSWSFVTTLAPYW